MGTIFRYRSVWTGAPGLPGYTTLYCQQASGDVPTMAQGVADRIRAFFIDFLATTTTPIFLPSVITITGDSQVDTISDTDGKLLNSYPITAGAPIVGGDAANYSQASGACITWNTAGIRRARRVRGRTYFVPLSSAYDATGTLGTSALTNFRTAATAFLTAMNGASTPLVVFGRPTPGTSDGASYVVLSGTVVDKAAVLTSRRD